jgi:tetratricopeptide (TPR) repeat protein
MKALYDLLGAHADDDAEALQKAFRKAVKAHHPDLHPGDPDAPSRFRQIVAANVILRDAKQRAAYDKVLQLERQQLQLKFECDQLRSKLEREQLRSKRMRATVAVAVIGALAGGYGLFAPTPTTTIIAIKKDQHAATAVPTVKRRSQPATDMAAKQNENISAAIAVARTDSVKGDRDSADEPAGARPREQANPPDRGEPRSGRDGVEVPNGAASPSADGSATSGTRVIADREASRGPPSNDANFYREQGIASYRRGDFQRAIANFDEAIRLDPDDARAYNIRGNAWDEMGVSERALADYDEAIRIDPNNPAVFHDRAILWHRKGALDKALVDLDRAIRFSFSDANIYCDRGLVWYEKGRHDRAIADFNQAIKLDPNFAAAYINRGVILHRNRKFNVALADGGKAIRVDPSVFDVTRRTNLRP